MQKSFFKLIWCAFPLTKIIYAYTAYTFHLETNNSFEVTSLLLMLFGIICCSLSILLSKKIHEKDFYESKIVRAFFGSRTTNNNANGITANFSLFVMLLGLAETAALFGFVQYIITGNLIVGIILFALCFIAWLFNYPNNQENQEEE
ncbi:MAG: hypothetical protein IKK38_06820 [Spirochaetaceae bacterium]|nr:hypothetical protein [Spirochaetaceae bacterium]